MGWRKGKIVMRFFRWLFRPRFIAVRYKIVKRDQKRVEIHNKLADELGVERIF